ncbi:hypothetical protein [Embleya sp. NPDC059237]|uniref:hypothetical protein n=1 Tax=Embleya sp. NPDC059237 TaxID=3346784 RepID=UPI0036839488
MRRPQAVEHLAQSPIDPASGMDVDVEDALVLRAQEQFPEPAQLVAAVRARSLGPLRLYLGPGQADSVPLRGHFTEMMLSVIFTGESEIAVD